MKAPKSVSLRTAVAGLLLLFGTVTANAGTLVIGLNDTGGPDQSKVQQYSTSGTFLGTVAGPADGIIDPVGFATDSAHNLYIASQNTNEMYRVTTGGAVSVFQTGLSAMFRVTSGPGDSAYFTQTAGGSTVKRLNSDGTVDVVVSGLTGPQDMTVTSAGTVYYSHAGGGAGKVFKFESGVSTEIADFGATVVRALTLDSGGNVLALFDGSLQSIDAGGAVSQLSAFGGIDLTLDDAGNIYIANHGAGTVRKLTSGGADLGVIVSGLSDPARIDYWDDSPVEVVEVPEPGMLAVFGLGLAALGFARRKRAA